MTEIAVATINPKRVVGMHFFNPAPVLQFVEVIKTVITSDEIFEDVKALAERLGKKPVIVGDKAGFIANALLFGYLNHAVAMYESKYATREDIDAAMKARLRLPHGAARAHGPHRARHRLRDPRHDVQAGPRPPARPEPHHQADGQRRAQGPQERPRLLHVCRPGQARRSSTTP